ncbi:MAG: hypothetical protein MUO60_18805, partial [Clostridiaceae bacterium]|nr:hypothetical protein [Clostridiaceae bacterium]
MKTKLLQLLWEKNLITEEERKEVVALSREKNCSEEQIIFSHIKVDLNGLISIMENDFNIPFIDLESKSVKNKSFNSISKEVAKRYSLIPFYEKNNE